VVGTQDLVIAGGGGGVLPLESHPHPFFALVIGSHVFTQGPPGTMILLPVPPCIWDCRGTQPYLTC
jgi:hypothetical protein